MITGMKDLGNVDGMWTSEYVIDNGGKTIVSKVPADVLECAFDRYGARVCEDIYALLQGGVPRSEIESDPDMSGYLWLVDAGEMPLGSDEQVDIIIEHGIGYKRARS